MGRLRIAIHLWNHDGQFCHSACVDIKVFDIVCGGSIAEEYAIIGPWISGGRSCAWFLGRDLRAESDEVVHKGNLTSIQLKKGHVN